MPVVLLVHVEAAELVYAVRGAVGVSDQERIEQHRKLLQRQFEQWFLETSHYKPHPESRVTMGIDQLISTRPRPWYHRLWAWLSGLG